jgi:hypothetical protein
MEDVVPATFARIDFASGGAPKWHRAGQLRLAERDYSVAIFHPLVVLPLAAQDGAGMDKLLDNKWVVAGLWVPVLLSFGAWAMGELSYWPAPHQRYRSES